MSGRVRPNSATLTPIMEDSFVSQESIVSGRASPLFPEGAANKAAGTATPCHVTAVTTFRCGHVCQPEVCTATITWPPISPYHYNTVLQEHFAHFK